MGTMTEDGMARYPFLPEAGEYIRASGFGIEQMANGEEFEPVRELAYSRVSDCLTGRKYRPTPRDQMDGPREIFSFIVAIMMIKASKLRAVSKRFALSESRRAEAHLVEDIGDLDNLARFEVARQIIRAVHGGDIGLERQDGRVRIPVESYLGICTRLHVPEWKMVNRDVRGGMVYLKPREFTRLLREEISVYILEHVRRTPAMDEPPGFEKWLRMIREEGKPLEPPAPKPVSGNFPPCMTGAIRMLEKGENLSHAGRFMLGTYLLARGQSVEEIAPLFKNAPDYNERTTMYQLKNLATAGRDGGGYGCPGCEKIKISGLCNPSSGCDGIVHPSKYHG